MSNISSTSMLNISLPVSSKLEVRPTRLSQLGHSVLVADLALGLGANLALGLGLGANLTLGLGLDRDSLGLRLELGYDIDKVRVVQELSWSGLELTRKP